MSKQQSRYALRDKKTTTTPHSLSNSYTEKDPQYYTSKSKPKPKSKSKMSRPNKKKTSRRKRQNGTTSTASSPSPTLFNNQIRKHTPERNDVLCGRGGSINSHSGNRAFRSLVAEQKQEYNTITDKFKKALISQNIIERIHNRGGQFLKKDGNNGPWIEVPMQQTLAKTSQALREGAPEIRRAAIATSSPGRTTSETSTAATRTSKESKRSKRKTSSAATRTSKESKRSKRKTSSAIQDEKENEGLGLGLPRIATPFPVAVGTPPGPRTSETSTAATYTSKESKRLKRKTSPSIQDEKENEESLPRIAPLYTNGRGKQLIRRPTSEAAAAAAMKGKPKEEETTKTMSSKEQSDQDGPLDSPVSFENDQGSKLSSPTTRHLYHPNTKRINQSPSVDTEAETPPLTSTSCHMETDPPSFSLSVPSLNNNNNGMGSLLSLPNLSSGNNNNNLNSHCDPLLSPSHHDSSTWVAGLSNNNIQNHASVALPPPPPQRNFNRENSLLSSDLNGSGDSFVGNEVFIDPFIDGYFDLNENVHAISHDADAATGVGEASLSNNGMSIHSEAPDSILRRAEFSSRDCSKLSNLSEIQASDNNDIDDDFIQPVLNNPCPHNTRLKCFRRTVSKDNLPLNTNSSSSSSSCMCDIVRNQGTK